MIHEPLVEHISVKSSSDRAFGLFVGTILFLLGLWQLAAIDIWFGSALLLVGLVLILLGLLAPQRLATANRLWLRLGTLLFVVISPIMMLAVYAVGVFPVGLIMRMMGKDLLRLRLNPQTSTYWIERQPPGPKPDSMVNQF